MRREVHWKVQGKPTASHATLLVRRQPNVSGYTVNKSSQTQSGLSPVNPPVIYATVKQRDSW